jgi:hypothetical protein
MEQSPSCEGNNHSASEEIPRLLWNSMKPEGLLLCSHQSTVSPYP